jgi:glycosyltransferase involved in cell wall biosynthesis/ubiquinone/menaquinone biosynthesis C-methylase UbiE
MSAGEDNTRSPLGHTQANDDPQGQVSAYFDSTASYWDGVYRGTDLQGLIYQRRQDAVLAYVDAVGLSSGATVLEIGCGAGHLTTELAERQLRVEAVDASDAMVETTRERALKAGLGKEVVVSKADVHALPFAMDHFDLVVAVGVIPWLHAPAQAIGEMARVLRPGGHLVVTADNRTRLTSFTDPRRIVAIPPLKRAYRTLRGREVSSMSQLHTPRGIDRMLEHAGLIPVARRTVGFGPFSILGRSILEGSAGIRINDLLQARADRGMPGLRWTGWHYVVRAEKRREFTLKPTGPRVDGLDHENIHTFPEVRASSPPAVRSACMNGSTQTPPRRIKVVTLVDYLTLAGGAERLALLIATRLDRDRFESILCVSRFPVQDGPELRESDIVALERLKQTDVRFLALKRRRKIEVAPWVRLERFLSRERVDVLHTHKFGSNVWGTLVGRIARVPVIVAHEHTWSYEGQPLRRFLDRELIARGADRFIAVSREDQRRMSEVEHIDPARTIFIPNGVPPLAAPSGKDLRSELGIAADAPVVGVVGMMRPQKAQDVLLRAVAPLAAEWPQLRVLIVGDGPERKSLEGIAAELGISEHVLFLGDRTDIPDVLGALDVAVSCSDFEGSPLAVMEYMDAGLAIVATAVGGTPDLIEDGVHGLLVRPRDPEALGRAIATLLRDRASAQAMGERARQRRESEFDMSHQMQKLEALYIELLEAAPHRARGRAASGLASEL